MTDPLLGRLIDGRYEVHARVASGGMATVYVAFDKRLERDVALKVMHQHLASDASEADFVARFRREAKAAARLTHPGMVRVYDQGVDGHLSYLTMEYVPGQNLRQRLNTEGTFSVGTAFSITESVLDALAAAHREGLVHRDVKPENVLLDQDDQPKLTDFGLARAVTEVTSTASGMLLGTVAYLAPEIVADGDADARADVYSSGILLYELVTGRQPYTAETALGVASRHVHEDMPAPSEVVPWLPVEIDQLVAAMTARDPQLRPTDASEALSLLRSTRGLVDDPTLDRRAEPPVSPTPQSPADGDTTVIDDAPPGSTIALPIGLGGSQALVAGVDIETIEDDPDAIEPERPRRRMALWIGAILATLVVLGGLGLWWYNSIGPGAYTTVPSIQGQDADRAMLTLESQGFVVDREEQYDDIVAAGIAIGTKPSEQSRILNGSDVTLIVSKGARQEQVPDLVGSTEEEAKAALDEIGFKVGTSLLKYSDTVPRGEVMDSTPAPGSTERHDAEVILEVSNGPEPFEMADLTGMTEEAAKEALAEHALEVTVEYDRTEDVAKGEVFGQSLAPGEQGTRTQEVTITVSEGLPLVTIPDFMFNTVDRATGELEELGLKVNLEADNVWPWTEPEFVVGQNPEPGTELEMGSTVTLRYDS